MISRIRRRKIRAARKSEFVVRVCRYRVLGGMFGSFVLAVLGGGLGVFGLVKGRLIGGVFALLVFCVWPITNALMARRSVGKIVLEFRPDGLKYYKRFLPWEQIQNVDVVRRRKWPDRIVLTMNRNRTVTISDELLDRTADELCHEIGRRCGATG